MTHVIFEMILQAQNMKVLLNESEMFYMCFEDNLIFYRLSRIIARPCFFVRSLQIPMIH